MVMDKLDEQAVRLYAVLDMPKWKMIVAAKKECNKREETMQDQVRQLRQRLGRHPLEAPSGEEMAQQKIFAAFWAVQEKICAKSYEPWYNLKVEAPLWAAVVVDSLEQEGRLTGLATEIQKLQKALAKQRDTEKAEKESLKRMDVLAASLEKKLKDLE